MQTIVNRWDSIDAYVAEASKPALANAAGRRSIDWDLGVTPKDAIRLATQGDVQLAARAQKVIADFTPRDNDELRSHMRLDVFGSRVNVSSYVAGNPQCMFRRIRNVQSAPHINVYVGIHCHCGVKADDMLQRGLVILGLLEALQANNIQTDLYLFTEYNNRNNTDIAHLIRVESRPLDLSAACFAIAHPAFLRNLTLPLAVVKNGIPNSGPLSRDREALRAAIGAEETDIYLPGVLNYSDSDELRRIIRNPQSWIDSLVAAVSA